MEPIRGHNQSISVGHISEEQEREKMPLKVENTYPVVEAASAAGFKNLIIETYPRMLGLPLFAGRFWNPST